MKLKFKGIILCTIATLAWGGMFIVTGDILQYMDPFYMTIFRYIPAGILFLTILILSEGRESLSNVADIKKLWLLGTLGFCGFSFLVFWGQSLNPLSGSILASVMMGLQPLIAVVVNRVLKGTKTKLISIIMMIMALLGVLLVITEGQLSELFVLSNLIPFLLIFLGATSWVVYSSGITFFPEFSPIKYTALTNVLGGASMLCIVFLLTVTGVLTAPTLDILIPLTPNFLYLIFIAGALAVLSWNNGNRILSPINASLFMCLVPTTTFLLSVIVNNYTISLYELIGLILIVFALVGNNLVVRKS